MIFNRGCKIEKNKKTNKLTIQKKVSIDLVFVAEKRLIWAFIRFRNSFGNTYARGPSQNQICHIFMIMILFVLQVIKGEMSACLLRSTGHLSKLFRQTFFLNDNQTQRAAAMKVSEQT